MILMSHSAPDVFLRGVNLEIMITKKIIVTLVE